MGHLRRFWQRALTILRKDEFIMRGSHTVLGNIRLESRRHSRKCAPHDDDEKPTETGPSEPRAAFSERLLRAGTRRTSRTSCAQHGEGHCGSPDSGGYGSVAKPRSWDGKRVLLCPERGQGTEIETRDNGGLGLQGPWRAEREGFIPRGTQHVLELSRT